MAAELHGESREDKSILQCVRISPHQAEDSSRTSAQFVSIFQVFLFVATICLTATESLEGQEQLDLTLRILMELSDKLAVDIISDPARVCDHRTFVS